MTSNRVIVDFNGRQFSADSMDRFGDDLTGLVLSYLTSDDKRGLEYVCKQWNHLIYNSITVLYIGNIEDNRGNEFHFVSTNQLHEFAIIFNLESRGKDLDRLRILFERCGSIGEIHLATFVTQDQQTDDPIGSQLMSVIAECCPQLASLAIRGTHFTDEAIAVFSQSCGQKLRHIHLSRGWSSVKEDYIDFTFNANKLLDNCQNVVSMVCENFSLLVNKMTEFLPKSKSLTTIITSKEFPLFNEFCLKYPKLKKLKLNINDCSYRQSMDIFVDLSSLTSLEDLEITLLEFNDINDLITINIDKQLTRIARNCSKLKRICLNFSHKFQMDCNIWQTFAEFKSLVDLKLCLTLNLQSVNHSKVVLNNLQKLQIVCNTIDEQLFDNIASFAPNLKVFHLKIDYFVDFTDRILVSLSALKHLKRLTFDHIDSRYTCNMTDTGVIAVLDKCRELTLFNLCWLCTLTKKTLDKLIEVANSRPKRVIRFGKYKPLMYRFPNDGEDEFYRAHYCDKPPNLKIEMLHN